jgi:tRNA-(ms[2]io[6]A)-hydroxylase
MLRLQSATSPAWLEKVRAHLPDVLIDHAHCEKKAAGTAMNLIFAHVDRPDVVRDLADIVVEELEHFRLVLDLIERRGITFRRQRPSSYGQRLHALARTLEPGRTIDRLLIAALIEARSCERFAVLRDGIGDAELAAFYGSLFESEARHHATYVQLATRFRPEEEVRRRLDELAAEEARIIAAGDEPARMHS